MNKALKFRPLRSRLFERSSKIALVIVAAALILGVVGVYALTDSGSANATQNMMNGITAMEHMMSGGLMHSMMNWNFDTRSPQSTGSVWQLKMNQMHRAMHGGDTDYDMNGVHERMISSNLTQEDLNEMKEHCPMMD